MQVSGLQFMFWKAHPKPQAKRSQLPPVLLLLEPPPEPAPEHTPLKQLWPVGQSVSAQQAEEQMHVVPLFI